jgi:hypothetical protein
MTRDEFLARIETFLEDDEQLDFDDEDWAVIEEIRHHDPKMADLMTDLETTVNECRKRARELLGQ